jgi:hypothetical protein
MEHIANPVHGNQQDCQPGEIRSDSRQAGNAGDKKYSGGEEVIKRTIRVRRTKEFDKEVRKPAMRKWTIEIVCRPHVIGGIPGWGRAIGQGPGDRGKRQDNEYDTEQNVFPVD